MVMILVGSARRSIWLKDTLINAAQTWPAQRVDHNGYEHHATRVELIGSSLTPGADKPIHAWRLAHPALRVFALCLIRNKGTSQEVAVLKLFFVLSLLMFAPLLVGFAGLVLVPFLALMPLLFAVGVVIFAMTLTFGVLMLVLRLLGAIVIGFGGLLIGALALMCLFAGGAVLFALGMALTHLLVPLLLLAGLIWLVRRAAKPTAPAIAHNPG